MSYQFNWYIKYKFVLKWFDLYNFCKLGTPKVLLLLEGSSLRQKGSSTYHLRPSINHQYLIGSIDKIRLVCLQGDHHWWIFLSPSFLPCLKWWPRSEQSSKDIHSIKLRFYHARRAFVKRFARYRRSQSRIPRTDVFFCNAAVFGIRSEDFLSRAAQYFSFLRFQRARF